MLLKSRAGDEGQRYDGGHEGYAERETDYVVSLRVLVVGNQKRERPACRNPETGSGAYSLAPEGGEGGGAETLSPAHKTRRNPGNP
jgi:hypothetical protein